MTYLLDTHVAIWRLFDERKLDKDHGRVIDRVERAGKQVAVSAISLWEIAKLVEHRRIELPRPIDECLGELDSALMIVPLSARIAIESTRLGARFHGDPADQLIVATARCLGMTLLTSDRKMIASGIVAVG
jgi:PIN domain nuclease of toxin-antitoxin system